MTATLVPALCGTVPPGVGAGLEPVGPPLPPTVRPATSRQWPRVAPALVAVGAVLWFAGRELPSWSVLAAALGRVDLPLLGVAAVLATFSLWLFARQQQVLFAGFGVRLPVAPVVGITYSRSAMSMTPATAGGTPTTRTRPPLACLLVTCAAFGVDVPAVQIGVVYLGIQLVRQIPLSPGGIGLIETSLVAGLTLLGTDNATAAAATLGYRLLSCWLVIPIGLTTWLALTRRPNRAPRL